MKAEAEAAAAKAKAEADAAAAKAKAQEDALKAKEEAARADAETRPPGGDCTTHSASRSTQPHSGNP